MPPKKEMKEKPEDAHLKKSVAEDEERMTRAGTPNTQLDWDPIVAKVNTALAAANQPIKTKEQLKMRWKYIMQHGQAAE